MKRIVMILAALLVLLLSGCCRHEWVAADCQAPEICANCQETQGESLGHDWVPATCEVPETCTRCAATQGEPLGHDWVPATCEAAETCTRCAATQGEALGHQYDGTWTVLDNREEMSQSCTVCGTAESTALDWCTYLNGRLQGRWIEESCISFAIVSSQFFYTFDSSQEVYYHPYDYRFEWTQPSGLEFTPDGRMRMLSAGSIQEGSYTLESYDTEEGPTYDAFVTMDSGTTFALNFSNYVDWEPIGYDHNWYMYDIPPDDNSFEDKFTKVNIHHENPKEADRLMLIVETNWGPLWVFYTKQDMTAPVAQAFSLPVGTWEPGEKVQDFHNTVTFTEVSTFTITGDVDISGQYRVSDCGWDTNRGISYSYELQLDDTSIYSRGFAYLYFDGTHEGYPQGVPYMWICLHPQDSEARNFSQYLIPAGEYPQDPGIVENPEEMYRQLVGQWRLTRESIEGEGIARISTDGTTLDIGVDGTFTLGLAEPVSGTWNTTPEGYSYWFYNQRVYSDYLLTLPADFSYEYATLSLDRYSGGRDELCLRMASAEGIVRWLYFSRTEQ